MARKTKAIATLSFTISRRPSIGLFGYFSTDILQTTPQNIDHTIKWLDKKIYINQKKERKGIHILWNESQTRNKNKDFLLNLKQITSNKVNLKQLKLAIFNPLFNKILSGTNQEDFLTEKYPSNIQVQEPEEETHLSQKDYDTQDPSMAFQLQLP